MGISPGVHLARDILRVDKKLSMTTQNNELNFDVYEEDGQGVIVTAFCNVCDGYTETVKFESLKEAQRQAAIWTLDDRDPDYLGICEKCRNPKVEYYKLVDDLDTDLETYVTMPMYDDHPDLGSFSSTYGVPHPEKGDYLIYDNGNIEFDSVLRNFCGVSFTHKPNLENLLVNKIIKEVSFELYSIDISLTNRANEVYEETVCLELDIDDMDREHFSEIDISAKQNKWIILNKQLEKLVDIRNKIVKLGLKI